MAYNKTTWINGVTVADEDNMNNIENGIEGLDLQINNAQTYSLTFNNTYIYDTDLDYTCVRIGNVVILNIHTLGFKLADYAVTDAILISGLPRPTKPIYLYMYGGLGAEGDTGRFRLNGEGQIVSWYGNISQYGDSANKQYSATLVYLTND